MSSMGAMSSGSFVSASDILSWVNEFLATCYIQIEQFRDGIIACQILSSIYPGIVPLHRVNWNPQYTYEYESNWRLIIDGLNRHKIDKEIDIARIVKGSLSDNLSFAQWLRHFWLRRYSPITAPYDAVSERQRAIRRWKGQYKARSKRLAQGSAPKRELVVKNDVDDALEGLTKERDWYYERLRRIELMCDKLLDQGHNQVQINDIFQILS